MPWWMTLALMVLALLAVDRLLLGAEARGWVHWRRSPPRRATAGNALQHVEALFRPEVRHVVEQQAAIDADADPDGDPPDPPDPAVPARDPATRDPAAAAGHTGPGGSPGAGARDEEH